MAASAPSLALLFVLAACAAGGACATTHTVGGNGQWTIMPSSPNAYTDWASGQTFAVGDDLVFNFQTGAHDVLEVTQSAYDACNIQNPTASYTTGPATVNLTRSGAYHFICGVGAHCSRLNQKMTLTVAAAAASTPGSAPSPRPSPTSGGPAAVPTPHATPSARTPTSSPGPSGTGTRRSAAPAGGAGKAAMKAVGVTSALAAALLL